MIVQISVPNMEDQRYKGIRFMANWNLINRQKGRIIPNVRKMNLASNESLISIEIGAICTGNLNLLFEAVNSDLTIEMLEFIKITL